MTITAAQPFRLATGGRIDRDRPLRFTCNGRPLIGYDGDTLASALLANGVRIVGRSFKYHRPRGVLSAGIEEPSALFRVGIDGTAVPLVRATMQPLVEGLSARSENGYPSIAFDFGRLIDFTHRLWPAGFYNKTFKWPSWRVYEDLIRRAAGLGSLPSGEDDGGYYHHNLHCDLLVCGAGPAGLNAALAASRSGANVVLIDQDSLLGGRLLAERVQVEGAPAEQWLERTEAELRRASNVRILLSTTVTGYYDHNVLTAHEQSGADSARGRVERFWKLRAREVVLATGAIEQPLLFANNDLPGIMLAGAVRQYVNRYAVLPGRTLVVATNNDDAYRTAFDVHDSGGCVAAIVDARPRLSAAVTAEARARRLTVIGGSAVTCARGSRGVRRVSVRTLSADGKNQEGQERQIDCDLLAMSGGWNPSSHLFSQAGGTLRYDERLGAFVPAQCRQRVRVVGAANGDFSAAHPLTNGAAADPGIRPLRFAPGAASGRQWLDFLHDVTTADIELAVRENFVSVEHAKRYTTAGMAIDQGKTASLNVTTLLADLTGRRVAEVGTTTFRPPVTPVTMGAIAGGARGELFAPARLLPAHSWHVSHGAELEDFGGWKRPACYRREGENRTQAIRREVLAARKGVGLFDGSPLGKIEVRGPDAAEFLNRIYVNNALTLQPGRVRYGLMLNENGIVIDDGVFARLSPEHFLVSTTSGGADRIAGWLDEWHQCEWPDLRIVLASVTTQWAVLTIVGPDARRLLQTLECEIDLSAERFPHMNVRAGRIAGVSARLQRVSFCGELSFEVSVAADRAEALWVQLMTAGADLGIAPLGIEAWMAMRIEKGFLHVGADTDGTTNPLDLGFAPAIASKQGDFVGRRSLARVADRSESRRQLVGFEPVNTVDHLAAGAHLVTGQGHGRRSEGFITSACFSPTLGRSIALGLLERGFARPGETVTVFDEGRMVAARVVDRTFYDPGGERMHG
jgi:sarcosine oxidase subunit alpha